MSKKDIKKLRQARGDKAKAGKTALDRLNALLDKDNATDTEKAEITTLEGQVDALEVEVCDARQGNCRRGEGLTPRVAVRLDRAWWPGAGDRSQRY